MKILCLHGKGTSGAIFRSQTSSFRAQLAHLNIEFDFLNGPVDDNAAAGIDLFYEPPYYSWWAGDKFEDLRQACREITDYITKNGPYDAAMMFSQGCSLGASLLLFHQEETPHLPPPFKTAIFICGGAPLAVLDEMGFHISSEARDRDIKSRAVLAVQAGSSAVLSQGTNRWTGLKSLDGGLSEAQLRAEIASPFRIAIPTVHVYGKKDPRYAAGVHLSGICEAENRRCYDHGGGHEIPRKGEVNRSMAELVEWALDQAYQ